MTTVTRIVKDYEERRVELLDAAQELFYRYGYENTSVANIIGAVGIAKGTFYHYFESKADLLDQIILRQSQRIDEAIDPIVENSDMNAVEKFNTLYSTIGHYKAENRDVMIMLTKVLYADENVFLLNKMTKNRTRTVAPRLAEIISQGIDEGVFHADSPEFAAEMILQMGTYLGEEFGRMVLDGELGGEGRQRYVERCVAYEKAVAKILGTEEGAIYMFDRDVIDRFFED